MFSQLSSVFLVQHLLLLAHNLAAAEDEAFSLTKLLEGNGKHKDPAMLTFWLFGVLHTITWGLHNQISMPNNRDATNLGG